MTTDLPHEDQLIIKAQAGDHDAWAELMHYYAPRVAAYLGARIRRLDVVDKLVMETIFAAWRHVHDAPTAGKFAGWLRRVGANLAIKWHKRHKNENLQELFDPSWCEDQVEGRRIQLLDQALGSLAEKDRIAIEHYYRGGLSDDELADALHYSSPQAALEQVQAALGRLYLKMREFESV